MSASNHPAHSASPNQYFGSPTAGGAHNRSSDSAIPSASTHKRTYQACIPCRRRKVRCDLGPVDNPHEPPCVRCRRESKECYFSATRRKRKGGVDDDGQEAAPDVYEVYNRRRKTSHVQDVPTTAITRNFSGQSPTSAVARSPSQSSPEQGARESSQQAELYPDSSTPAYVNTPGDQEVTNETAAVLFQSPINQPADALHLLLEASGRTGDLQRHASARQGEVKPIVPARLTPDNRSRSRRDVPHQSSAMHIDPAITGNAITDSGSAQLNETLKIWTRLRFVRAGWLTAREAMSYIDYFYDYIAPLTPVSPPDLRLLHTHKDLLSEEPMLTVTVLYVTTDSLVTGISVVTIFKSVAFERLTMELPRHIHGAHSSALKTISSRYKSLSGPGGKSRSYRIHDRLWEYLQRMISRMFFSQEQFGGGFCGAGSKAGEQGRLRTLGTIESLLLLSDFHPRSMHFPAGDDGDEILMPANEGTNDNIVNSDGEPQKGLTAGQASFMNWTEPALRSDRMCWSLVGAAHTLAHELGLFGGFAYAAQAISARAKRLKRLLYVYISQTSGRLGLASMFPSVSGEGDFAYLERTLFYEKPQDLQDEDTVVSCWVDIASIMRVSNLRLFPSRSETMGLIRSGEYLELLAQFRPMLHSWWTKFEKLNLPRYPRSILTIEYEYARVYINSLPLQAVLDQWTSNNSPAHTQQLSNLYRRNEHYVREVVNSARNLLRQIVEGLLPDQYLKHVPVRTFFRILSGAMFLLKSFALGAKENDVKTSLNLLDRTIKALRTSVVDDVHLSLQIADLLEGLTTSVRHKFVRLAGRSVESAAQQVATPSSQSLPSPYPAFQRPEMMMRHDAKTPISDSPSLRNISFMPPPNNTYNVNDSYAFSPAAQLSPAQPQQPQLYPTNSTSAFSGSTDDWLTLDLNPLLDTSSFGGMENPWFGNFGPEINSNLDVLGPLVNEQFRVEGFEEGDLGF